jgi:hypothetical protein
MAANNSERVVLLNHLADEFTARYRRGERPALQEYIDRHPELADDIRAFSPDDRLPDGTRRPWSIRVDSLVWPDR